ncbi:RagB/SusD family nutrient uptake outer membrane protein [Mucilaginibacter jinjuensis]|uniref:RagB/SusD family nutrient uptake outer membrane protein n=1 Tax=Mucilaginibacter jinjuensis TaxID=1176721 RepID=A0ABY7TEA9_9SPHI|nr:RagB/SusD family nutrient uptake outer membrane protein [Mucilaginibacter jinjuensis]WCT14855.1 RagB/SusD family nutrient uptake outer membrane protein [Mucilaginibacter jinjuensis]
MKKLLYLLIGVGLVTGIYSCQKTFLQKPNTTGSSTIETVFSNTTGALSALSAAYRLALIQGLPYSGLGHGTLSGISGEMSKGYNWHATFLIAGNGMSPNPGDGNDALADDKFSDDYASIRKNYLVLENVDKVSDMDAATKATIKAEMTGLNAYRYMGMFIRYGGVPIVTKSFDASDNLSVPRGTLQQTLDQVTTLCDAAIAGLPDKWPDNFGGRLTKGSVLAIKARTLMFAARPLFNTATPYLSFGSNNKMICFGNQDQNRWTAAITANEAMISWANANGYGIINTGGGINTPNTKAFDDYGNATSTPSNREVILAYKVDEGGNGIPKYFNRSPYYNLNGDRYDTDNSGTLSNFMTNYYKADGTDQTWPGINDAARPYSEYNTKIMQMEPRCLVDNLFPGIDAANNAGDYSWSVAGWQRGIINQNGGQGKGNATTTKFYYHAGSRLWMEFPLFRMAEFYLNLAEAYNEVGNTAKALENLNVVHNRAGLPSITTADQSALRKAIQREWAVEFYNENQRYFLVKHWKLDDIGNGLLGGAMREFSFTTVPGAANVNLASALLTYKDYVTYTAYWNPKMYLDPFPQAEINKGIIVQNPGY